MEQINSSPTHNLIPEKEPTFSSKKGIFFDDYLKQFEEYLGASVAEFKDWEDETILLTLQRKGVILSALDQHKLLAFNNFDAKKCYISTSLEFKNIATLLNEDVPITDFLDTIDPAYVSWAIEVLERHDDNNEIELTDNVAHYITTCFYEEGFLHMPENLTIFNDDLDQMNAIVPAGEEANDKIERVNEYLEKKRSELEN